MNRQEERHKQHVVDGTDQGPPRRLRLRGAGRPVRGHPHRRAHARAAMDSDRVSVEWWVGRGGLEGRVLSVLERGRGKITGQIVGTGKTLHLEPDDPRSPGRWPCTAARRGQGGPGGGGGDPPLPETPDGPLEVSVLKVLGDPTTPHRDREDPGGRRHRRALPARGGSAGAEMPQGGVRGGPARPPGSAPRPLHHHRSGDGARLR
jgi:hypothetical protein